MIERNVIGDRLLCDCCTRYHDKVHLVIMGYWLNRIWSWVFCVACIMEMHNNYMYIRKGPVNKTMNVSVRGQNLSISEILVYDRPITIDNADRFDLLDYPIVRE